MYTYKLKLLILVPFQNDENPFNGNERFVIYLTFKLMAWFIGGFTLEMKSQSIVFFTQ